MKGDASLLLSHPAKHVNRPAAMLRYVLMRGDYGFHSGLFILHIARVEAIYLQKQ